MSPPQPETDLELVVRIQHENIRVLAELTASGPAAVRASPFSALTLLLRLHEAAETIVLDPILAMAAGSTTARIHGDDECRINDTLALLQAMDPMSTRFLQYFVSLRAELEDHMEFEERELFPLITSAADRPPMRTLGERFVVEELLVDPQGLIDSIW